MIPAGKQGRDLGGMAQDLPISALGRGGDDAYSPLAFPAYFEVTVPLLFLKTQ